MPREDRDVLVTFMSELKNTTTKTLEEKDKHIAVLDEEMKTRLEEKDKLIAMLDDERKAMQEERKAMQDEKKALYELISKQSEKIEKHDAELPEKVASLLDDRLRAHCCGCKKRKFDDGEEGAL